MGAVVSKCSQLSSLNLEGCGKITDAAVLAVASGCKQLTALDLSGCKNITDAAVVAVTSGCKQLGRKKGRKTWTREGVDTREPVSN